MKIKNWKKLSETRWVHEPTGIQIYVKEHRAYSLTYDKTDINWEIRYDYMGENKLLDRAKYKETAIKKAINAQKYYNQHHFC